MHPYITLTLIVHMIYAYFFGISVYPLRWHRGIIQDGMTNLICLELHAQHQYPGIVCEYLNVYVSELVV